MGRERFNQEQYLTELTADLPEADAAAVKTAFGNKTVADRLADSVLRNQDYGRLTSEIRKEREDVQAFYKQLVDIDKQNKTLIAEQVQKVGSLEAQIAKYKEEFGEQATPAIDTSNFVTRKELEEQALAVQRGWIDFAAELSQISAMHVKEFGEVLDTKALIADASARKQDIRTAYEASISDRRAVASNAANEVRWKEAYEKGKKDALASTSLPHVPIVSELSPLELHAQLGEKTKIPSWKRGMEDLAAGRFEKDINAPDRV